MTPDKFIHDLHSLLKHGKSQTEISRLSNVSQGTISKIIKGKKSILFSTAIKLWPVVYGVEFPFQPQESLGQINRAPDGN